MRPKRPPLSVDLEFPHHENEIAQSEAKNGQKFANYWMHNGFVTIGQDDEKMSKSLGNFVTVHELVKKLDPQIVRFLMATTQYRHPIRYSQANLDDAKTNLNKLKTAAQNVRYRLEDAGEGALETWVQTKVEALVAKFKVAMDDDFNTQNGITVVYELARELNVYAAREEVNRATLEYLLQNFATLVEIFGIEFENEELGDEKIEALIKKRDEARANRDFATSDEIRDTLKDQGIILEDTPQGTRWKRG